MGAGVRQPATVVVRSRVSKKVSVTVLALDLERTLVDNSLNGRPRPDLLEFLTFCAERFERVVIYTTVEDDDARAVLTDLDRAGYLPPGLLGRLEYIGWSGEYKDLAFVPGVPPAEVLLVDDDPGWVRPDQQQQWVPIAPWDGGPDSAGPTHLNPLENRLFSERMASTAYVFEGELAAGSQKTSKTPGIRCVGPAGQ